MKHKIVLIGASTGGPSQIKELLSSIQTLHCTIIVAQHMREEVIPFFIKDLQESLHVRVVATPLETSFRTPSIIICKETSVLKKTRRGFFLEAAKESQCYTPDINKLLHSFVAHSDNFDISVYIMTGIGHDGVEGAKALKAKGAKIYAQDEQSSPVYGMPKAAFESGIVDSVQSLEMIKNSLGVCNGSL